MTCRKPTALKLLASTARPDRIAPATSALPVLDAVPTPPSWLTNVDAVKEWRRLSPVLVATRLLHEGNVAMLGQLCALHGRLVEMWIGGKTPTAALLSAYRGLCNTLGLSGMVLAPPADKPNRFANNGTKRR